MDHLQAKWLSEMEMNMGDPALIQEWRMKSTHLSNDKNSFFHPFCSESHSTIEIDPEGSENGIGKPAIQLKNNNNDWNSHNLHQKTSNKASSSASTNFISFGNSNSTQRTTHHHHQHNGMPNCNVKIEAPAEVIPLGSTINFLSPFIPESSSIEEIYGAIGYGEPNKGSSGSGIRTCLQAKEHVLAERKRREKLTRQFIELSSMIPGLQKLDKSSILGGAIKHIKEFEEEKKRIYEENSAVSSKRCRLSSHDDTSSSNENFDMNSLDSSPKIDVKISDENVVFIIDCKELKGIIDEISGEAKKLHLRVISSCSMELGNGKLLITILAKMDDKFSLTAKDLASNIRMTILNLM